MEHGAERLFAQPIEYPTVRFARTVVNDHDTAQTARGKIVHIMEKPLFGFI
jgi:hypothetical protein